jgi:HPt (histidine-containing phosphotransfer) domain-containing protein
MSEPADVTILPPNTSLQRKVGGSAAAILSPSKVKAADAAVVSLADAIRADVTGRLNEIDALARTRTEGSRDLIWAHAHEIRGMAGTARMKRLGEAADLLCRYLDDTPSAFTPDANLLTTIVVTALQTVKPGAEGDDLITLLLTDCAQAVKVQRQREGR